MKKRVGFIAAMLVTFLPQFAPGQNTARNVPADSLTVYYSRLAGSPNEGDKVQLAAALYKLLQSNNEQDWLTAQRYFRQINKISTADSVLSQGRKKFPLGQWVRNDNVQILYNEKDPVKKERLYKALIKKFPPRNFGPNRITYDYARFSVASAYAQAGKVRKAVKYANMIETPSWKGEGWAGTAGVLMKAGYNKKAEALYKKAWEVAYQAATIDSAKEGARFAAIGLPGYTRSLVKIFLKRKDYEAALKYLQPVYNIAKTVNGSLNEQYAKVLMMVNREAEAFPIIDQTMKAGQASPEIRTMLQSIWPKIKGSNAGYDSYVASVNKLVATKIRQELQEKMMKLPAPAFTLKDVDGNTVSLSDLKGRIVVLDFWATWCGPCKASFPAMKRAVEKFEHDADVKFLFIHTWERGKNAVKSAKEYVVNNNYPFEVLMDLKNSEGVNKVVTDYKVSGIPTKFVIDGNGQIRFRFTGANGKYDAVEELTAMIELVKKTG